MLRAVEVLAQMHERARRKANEPPAPLDRPVVLQCDRLTVDLAKTNREAVERELGVAFSYPARGWHTYATKEGAQRCLLSLFYHKSGLVAAELYVPRNENGPRLEARNLGGFRLEPGGISIGMNADAITQIFTPAVGGPGKVVYDRAFEARFPGGVAYAMARAGTIERLALYADTRPA
jgi:hypothetical protein